MSPAPHDPATTGAAPRFPPDDDVAEVPCDDSPLFTGRVRTRIARRATGPEGLTVMATRFAPGAGTVWHSHDTDQTLVVTGGRAGLDEIGRGLLELAPGDVVTVAAGTPHRHLALGTAEMTHLSVTGRGETRLHPAAAAPLSPAGDES